MLGEKMKEHIDKKIGVYIAFRAYKPRPSLDELGLEETEELYNIKEDPVHVRFSNDVTNEKYVIVSIEEKDDYPDSKMQYTVGDGTLNRILLPAVKYYVLQMYNSENKKVRLTIVCEYSKGNHIFSYIRNNFLQKGYKIHKVNNNTTIPVKALKQLKGLLDEGIITQEDFDAKKKQLLGL